MNDKYILMCKEATEIRKQWKPKGGDRVISLHFNRCELEYLSTNIENKEASVLFHKHGSIWLPRQEDLQKIYGEHYNWNFVSILQEFNEWFFNKSNYDYKSNIGIHELWLCFVMETVYGKAWNNEKKAWVKQ